MYQNHCLENGFNFENVEHNHSVLSPDKTSLFCTSGMHHLKSHYADNQYINTFGNIQKCLRLNDLEELKCDNQINEQKRHWLIFHMVGLFSFRQLSVKETIFFILSFLEKLQITPDYFTIHEDKYHEWKDYYIDFYQTLGKEVPKLIIDSENCTWQASPNEPISYCTEIFYKNIEIGNIVNPRGNCIDVGLGMERLLMLSPLSNSDLTHHQYNQISNQEILLDTIEHLLFELDDIQKQQIEQGTQYLHKGVGFQLKKLILFLLEYQITQPTNELINERISKLNNNENKLFQRIFNNKCDKLNYILQQKSLNSKIWKNGNAEFWKDVHGISNDMYLAIINENDYFQNMINFFDLNV